VRPPPFFSAILYGSVTVVEMGDIIEYHMIL
jgi:hypothetical protein